MLQKFYGFLKFCVTKLHARNGSVYNDSILIFWTKLGLRLVLGLMKDSRFEGTFVDEAVTGLVSHVEALLHHALSLILNGLLAKCKFQ